MGSQPTTAGDRDDTKGVTVHETIGETLARMGYLEMVREELPPPDEPGSLSDELDWTPREPCGADMRRLIDAFDAYASLVLETTGRRVAVHDLVDALLTLAHG